MLRVTRSALILLLALACLLGPGMAAAQDWGSDEEDWQPNENQLGGRTTAGPPTTPWSLRAGTGFTVDPDNLLLNFEVPYRFDQYVAAGPMMQVGLGDDRYLVFGTANLTITGANLFEGDMARFEPNLFAEPGYLADVAVRCRPPWQRMPRADLAVLSGRYRVRRTSAREGTARHRGDA